MRKIRITVAPLALVAWSLVGSTGCPQSPKEDPPQAAEPTPEPAKVEPMAPDPALRPELDLSGPVPPETSAVYFAIDGALVPLACFDAAGKRLLGGAACAAVVPEHAEVVLWAPAGRAVEPVTGRRRALCEFDDAKETAYATRATEDGQQFDFATWPKSVGPTVWLAGAKAQAAKALELTDEESAALAKAIDANGGRSSAGPVRLVQRAVVDLDGDGADDVLFSAAIDDPRDSERQAYAGLFLAPGGDLSKLTLLERTRRNDLLYVRAAVDLDGSGTRELHIGLTYDGGSSDRFGVLEGGKLRFLGPWTCGA